MLCCAVLCCAVLCCAYLDVCDLLLAAGTGQCSHEERSLGGQLLVVGLGGEGDHLLPAEGEGPGLPERLGGVIGLFLDLLEDELFEAFTKAWHFLQVVECSSRPVLQDRSPTTIQVGNTM